MRRVLTTVITIAALAVPSAAFAPAVWAQDDETSEPSGSLVEQVLRTADATLGEDANIAVLRAYDRGYDFLQIVEALLEGQLGADGTISDDEGAALAPFRAPSNVIEENAEAASARLNRGGGVPMLVARGEGASVETIALALLERGIATTTKQLDKKVDLEARAEDAGVSDESLFTMVATLFLMAEGYSPEQIIVDGFAAGGIQLVSPVDGLQIVDENGKRIKPDGVEESPEHEEAADQIDAFVGEIVDTIAGITPQAGADTPFKTMFRVEIEIAVTGDGSATFVGSGRLGLPRDKSLRGFLVGKGDGDLVGAGECSLSEGGIVGDAGPHPYEVSGPVTFGFSGPASDGQAKLRIALVEVNATVVGDDSFCVDLIRDLAGVYESLTFGPVELRLKNGATGTATSTFGDSTVDVTLTLSS